MMGFKAFHSAQATIAGIETAHMIRKGQLSEENIPAYKQSITTLSGKPLLLIACLKKAVAASSSRRSDSMKSSVSP
jgi:hypothetical protein